MKTTPYRPLDTLRPERHPELAPIQVGIVVDPVIGSNRIQVAIGSGPRSTRATTVAGLDANTGDRVLMTRPSQMQSWVAFANIDTADSASTIQVSGGGVSIAAPDEENQVLIAQAASPSMAWERTIPNARVRGELRASHFSMGEVHGLGGTTYIAPCAGLKNALTI